MNIRQNYLLSLAAGALIFVGCETDDPRPPPPPVDNSPRQLGELCYLGDDAEDDTPDCAESLSCFPVSDDTGVCTNELFAEACTAADGEGNLPCSDEAAECNARGTSAEDLVTFCRCPEGQDWDGANGCADIGATFAGSVLDEGQTCPPANLANGDPDPNAVECPENTTFCTEEESGGDCLAYDFTVTGTVTGASVDFAATSTTGAQEDVVCIRSYEVEGEGDDATTTSNGLTLEISGDVAGQIAGAGEVSIQLIDFDVSGADNAIIWPRDRVEPRSRDSAYLDVTIDGETIQAIGGSFTVSEVVGTAEDGIIPDGEGQIAGNFYIALPEGDFLTGSYVSDCGTNVVAPAPAAADDDS